jgi:anti-sigma factor RsiW
MSSTSLAHLGDLAAAFVDDQLDPATRDLVLSHVAGCPGCRADVEQQRRLKARLRALGEPGLPTGLLLRLSSLNVPGEPPAPPPPVLGPPARRDPTPVAVRPASPLPASGPLGRSSVLHSARPGRLLLAGAASLLLVGAGTAYAASGDTQRSVPGNRAVTAFTAGQQSGSPTSVPLNAPAFAAMTASFHH